MDFLRNNTPQVDGNMTVVTGRTLSETFKLVRQEFGPDAVISGSRTNTRRKSSGWGTEQVVEVLVENPGTSSAGAGNSNPDPDLVTANIRREVERLEKMVEDICDGEPVGNTHSSAPAVNPLGEFLVENGASVQAVDRMLTRFSGETGSARDDRPAALAWLSSYLGSGQLSLTDFSGTHAILGEHSGDRLDLVLQLAGRMTKLGRRVLVVSLMPDPDRHLPLLRSLASQAGHDAAVVQDPDQLSEIDSHIQEYDLVLLDMPALADPVFEEGGPIHKWLAGNLQIHRHLQVPLDRDFLDLSDLRDAARVWNCDSLALTRLEGTRRPAKILDLVDTIPLPVSILADSALGGGYLEAATAELLLDRILTAKEGPKFKPGLEIERA
jgi:hypothetical protein